MDESGYVVYIFCIADEEHLMILAKRYEPMAGQSGTCDSVSPKYGKRQINQSPLKII